MYHRSNRWLCENTEYLIVNYAPQKLTCQFYNQPSHLIFTHTFYPPISINILPLQNFPHNGIQTSNVIVLLEYLIKYMFDLRNK